MTFREKPIVFFAIFEGKIQGIFYCNRWGDGHLWSGRNGLKRFTAFKAVLFAPEKYAVDPKRKRNCSSSKKNTKNKVLCLLCLCHVSFGEGFFAARFSFGASPMSVFGGYIGWLPRRWRGDPVSWTEPVSWDQVVVESKMDPWCCLPPLKLT